jgi:histidinol-phosphatase (PHP family)
VQSQATSFQDIDLRCDGHVHTKLCNHASGEMEEYVCSAIARGLNEIIFLEHLEVGIDYIERTWLSEDDFDYYFAEGIRLRRKYAEHIRVGTGVELGYNSEHNSEIFAQLSNRPWDKVGISCHFLKLPGTDHHLNLLSRKQHNIDIARQFGLSAVLEIYFDTLLEAIESVPVSRNTVLCHLDAALRFADDLTYTPAHYQQIENILVGLKKKGISLEINTSGFAIRKEPFPARHILAMALRYDIPLLPGSDAHQPEDVGRYFSVLPDYITSAASA